MAFIDVLNLLLMERNISRNKFCADMHIGKNSVAHWENRGNTPDGEVLAKIATYFGVTVDYLLDAKKPDTPEGERPVMDEAIAKLLRDAQGLSRDEAEQVQQYIRFVKQQRPK